MDEPALAKAQTPRLSAERIDVEGPLEGGDYLLRDRLAANEVRLSSFEYDLVRRFDGQRTVAEVHAAFAREQGVDVSPTALKSLLAQLARSGLLTGYAREEPALTAPLPGGANDDWQDRVDATERAFFAADASAQSEAARRPEGPSPAAWLGPDVVDEAEVNALAQAALERVAAGELRQAANILRQAASLAPKQAHLEVWAARLTQLAAQRPKAGPRAVWDQLLALAPVAASRLAPPAALIGAGAQRPAPAQADQAVVLLARSLAAAAQASDQASPSVDAAEAGTARSALPTEPAEGAVAAAAGSRLAAEAAMLAGTNIVPAEVVAAAAQQVAAAMAAPIPSPPSVPVKQRGQPLAPPAPLSLPVEGTLGLPLAEGGLGTLAMPAKLRRGPLGFIALLALALGAAGWWLWQAPAVESVALAPVFYRLNAPGEVTGLSWPHNSNVLAPAAGKLSFVAKRGARLERGAVMAVLEPPTPGVPRSLAMARRHVARLAAELKRAAAASTKQQAARADPWALGKPLAAPTAPRAARLIAQQRRLEAKLAAAQAALAAEEKGLVTAPRTLLAPQPGLVTAAVAAGTRQPAGGLLLQLQDRKLVRLAVRAPTTLGRRVGDAVSVTLRHAPASTLVGHVVDVEGPVAPPTGAVDRAARRAGGHADARLLIDVTDDKEILAEQPLAEVVIVQEDVAEATLAPRSAVFHDAQTSWLWRIDDAQRLLRLDVNVLAVTADGVWLRWPGRGRASLRVVRDASGAGLGVGRTVRPNGP